MPPRRFLLIFDFMKPTRNVKTSQGTVKAIINPMARQTFVALPTGGAGVAARVQTTNITAIRAGNSRQKF